MYLLSKSKKPPRGFHAFQKNPPEKLAAQLKPCDRTLVTRAQSGEQAAFNALVAKYWQRVMRLSLRYTGNLADAEDAAQNTFVKAYRGLAHFRGDCAFYSWLHRIAINSAKNVRLLRARDEFFFDSAQYGVTGTQTTAVEVRDWNTPESLAVTEEMCGALSEAIESLCKEQRTAIILRELEGLSYSAIADSMCCPIGTIRSRVFRARDAINRQLRRVFDEGLGRTRVRIGVPANRTVPLSADIY
jgi:RNA polymerase sigma-70 factor, ECF subfamily